MKRLPHMGRTMKFVREGRKFEKEDANLAAPGSLLQESLAKMINVKRGIK
jgi:hypothetical protein